MNLPVIDLPAALDSLLKRPVLVLGPAATASSQMEPLLLEKILDTVRDKTIEPEDSLYKLGDILKTTHPEFGSKLGEIVGKHLKSLTSSAQVRQLVTGGWSAIVSLVPDSTFEDALRERFDNTPSSWTMTLVAHPSVVPSPQSTPVYKLLGDFRDQRPGHSLVLSTSDTLKRKQQWSRIIATLSDVARNAPFLFVGTGTDIESARDFLSTIYSGNGPFPSRLLFLKGDGTIYDATIRALAFDHSEIAVVDASLKQFCDASAAATLSSETISYLDTSPTGSGVPSPSLLSQYHALIEVVPIDLPSNFDVKRSHRRLIDGLFRPTALDFLPYLANVDLQREITQDLIDEVTTKGAYIGEQRQSLILLRGEAGVGKSTVLRRAAVDLARRGELVLWIKRPPYGSSNQKYNELAKGVNRLIVAADSPYRYVVLVCDDPWGIKIDPAHVLRQFEYASVPAIMIAAARHTDELSHGSGDLPFPVTPDGTIDVPHLLTEGEIRALPAFLVRLGIAADDSSAQTQVASVPRSDAADILCSLWYLVPETKTEFTASLQDEYARLGGVSGAIEAFAAAASSHCAQARRAYECVAVASNLNIAVPLEVLVRAIGADYDDWLMMCVAGRPVWGLLYDEADLETGNIVYRTRNHLVTKVLLELVNGGAGHAGEFRVLKSLVKACDRSSVPYYSFLVDLLVTRRKGLERILSYDWGVELYELAIQTFPDPVRVIEHHFGTWHRWKGNPRTAYEQYRKALETENYAHADRVERPENIHTSMAATVVEMVKNGEQDRETALDLVQMHLQETNTDSRVDPHSDHVFANALFQLARLEQGSSNDDVALRSVADSLRTIEHSLQTIGASGRYQREFSSHIQALHDLQTNVIGTVENIEEIKGYAHAAFERSGTQAGFEVVARRLLSDAMKTGRGRDFKDADIYVAECVRTIESAEKPVAIDLLATRIDLYVRWRLQRTRGHVEWDRLKNDLDKVLANSKYQNDLVKMYYLGLTLFHLGEYTAAEATFRALQRKDPARRVLRNRRNYFLGNEGAPRRLQGEIRRAHGRAYVFVPELQRDFRIDGRSTTFGEGATVHCYVSFSLAGPSVTFDPPRDGEAEMP